MFIILFFQENLPDAVLPPSELRLKCVIKFIKENRDKMKDIKWLTNFLFENSSKISMGEGESKLKEVLCYYEDVLLVSKASRIIPESSGKKTF